jgi:hypothetical protein
MFIDCHAHSLSADEKRYPPRDHPLRPFDPDDPHSPGEEGRNGDPTPVVARPSWPWALYGRDAPATWVA